MVNITKEKLEDEVIIDLYDEDIIEIMRLILFKIIKILIKLMILKDKYDKMFIGVNINES